MRSNVVEAGATAERTQALGLQYPKGVYSLSHVALPFPLSDSLYGLTPDQTEDFGVHLGSLAPLRRARDADRQLGRAAAHVVQPILFLYGAAYRGASSGPARRRRNRARRSARPIAATSRPAAASASQRSARHSCGAKWRPARKKAVASLKAARSARRRQEATNQPGREPPKAALRAS